MLFVHFCIHLTCTRRSGWKCITFSADVEYWFVVQLYTSSIIKLLLVRSVVFTIFRVVPGSVVSVSFPEIGEVPLYIRLVITVSKHALVSFNPLEFRGNYSATSNNMEFVHWPLMGGLLHLVQRGEGWAGPQFVQVPPCCAKCNSPPINGQCTNNRIVHNCCIMVRCSAVLIVAPKGLMYM